MDESLRNKSLAPSPTAKLCGSTTGVIAFCMLETMDTGMLEMKRSKMPTSVVSPATSGEMWDGMIGNEIS